MICNAVIPRLIRIDARQIHCRRRWEPHAIVKAHTTCEPTLLSSCHAVVKGHSVSAACDLAV